MRPPRTRYARTGELSIAYQVFGAGDTDLVFVPGFVSHLDLIWENPTRASVTRRFGEFARVIEFDKRNTGLSDRTFHAPTLEERMDDIRAVMDAAGSERAALVAYSEGGPLAVLFAATYPERVTALALSSTFHRQLHRPDMDDMLALVEQYWGTGLVMNFFDPGCDMDWAARFERSAATPRSAVEILRLNADLDVSMAAAAVRAPTLVLHRTLDPVVPVEAGRDLAAAIGGARLEELPGDSHLPRTERDWHHEVDLIEEFLTGARRTSTRERVLATVLFTDIVASTARAARIGDDAWRHQLDQHLLEVSRTIAQYRGTQVKGVGDGVLATFDGPARAIRCALALTERATGRGLPIRAGLHAGEVEVLGDDVAGIAVHLAKRVEEAAEPGAVFVSQTVRDLVAGSGIEFADAGLHDLKGVADPWRLHQVLEA